MVEYDDPDKCNSKLQGFPYMSWTNMALQFVESSFLILKHLANHAFANKRFQLSFQRPTRPIQGNVSLYELFCVKQLYEITKQHYEMVNVANIFYEHSRISFHSG